MKTWYTALNLTSESRSELLGRFRPSFRNIVAHHVTLIYGVKKNSDVPKINQIKIIGYAKNENIECVVVEVSGSIARPGGGLYHITISHNESARPVDSNALLLEKEFAPVDEFFLHVEPMVNPE